MPVIKWQQQQQQEQQQHKKQNNRNKQHYDWQCVINETLQLYCYGKQWIIIKS